MELRLRVVCYDHNFDMMIERYVLYDRKIDEFDRKNNGILTGGLLNNFLIVFPIEETLFWKFSGVWVCSGIT